MDNIDIVFYEEYKRNEEIRACEQNIEIFKATGDTVMLEYEENRLNQLKNGY